jgi:methionyl-tRNA formyltransferase
MKLAILTTETPHHAHFARVVSSSFEISLIVSETRAPHPPFPTAHPFESQRDEYERQVFFAGRQVALADTAKVLEVGSANDGTAIDALRTLAPDVIVVFGTGRIGRDLMGLCPGRIINLHGGDPERYRGLDTHLWAIYHREFDGLIATLHHLSEGLDRGDIILQSPVPIGPGMSLHALRARNTQTLIELTLAGLDVFKRFGRFLSRPQRQVGRYYSFMPAVLKEVCVRHFEDYVRRLK